MRINKHLEQGTIKLTQIYLTKIENIGICEVILRTEELSTRFYFFVDDMRFSISIRSANNNLCLFLISISESPCVVNKVFTVGKFH